MSKDLECPNCGWILTADEVDIGVGWIRCGPFGCEKCHWIEPDHREEIKKILKDESFKEDY